tara:strand:- start:177 stop:332 length:156 start_codon:yes stop_codon:yes gene_type:complete
METGLICLRYRRIENLDNDWMRYVGWRGREGRVISQIFYQNLVRVEAMGLG